MLTQQLQQNNKNNRCCSTKPSRKLRRHRLLVLSKRFFPAPIESESSSIRAGSHEPGASPANSRHYYARLGEDIARAVEAPKGNSTVVVLLEDGVCWLSVSRGCMMNEILLLHSEPVTTRL